MRVTWLLYLHSAPVRSVTSLPLVKILRHCVHLRLRLRVFNIAIVGRVSMGGGGGGATTQELRNISSENQAIILEPRSCVHSGD